jgi:23S rRNA (guanosine2251-2'-O)-methyltransferase
VLDLARRGRIPVRREPRTALDRLTHNANHQGVVAIAAAAAYADADLLLASVSSETIFVLLDGIEDPQNLGAIIRTAECSGATAVIIPERRAAQLTETVGKTSAGALEHLPVARVTNLAAFIDELKKSGVWIVGVERSGKTSYTDFDYGGPLALVFGSESQGMHRLVRERCDILLTIPMQGQVTSLNASVAAGVVLFEALRQRSNRASQPSLPS